jgi:hypothetical protein
MVHGCQGCEGLIALNTITGTLDEVARRDIPLSGKKNYFWYIDHWNSLYQPKANHKRTFEGVQKNGILRLEKMIVGYLVEDNAMDDFCLSSELDGTHGKPTFEDDPEQQLLRRAAHGKMAQWRVQAGNKMQMLGMILVTGEKVQQ